MRTLKIALLATVAAAALTSATVAADPIIMVDDPVIDTVSFDWEGPYAGLYLLGQTVPSAFGLGADLGVNILAEGVLFGVEADIAWLSNGSWEGQVVGRLGMVVSDPVLLYALAGIGAHSAMSVYVPLGVGVEFAVADNMSVKAQYEYHWDLDNAAQSAHVGKIGVNFHF